MILTFIVMRTTNFKIELKYFVLEFVNETLWEKSPTLIRLPGGTCIQMRTFFSLTISV